MLYEAHSLKRQKTGSSDKKKAYIRKVLRRDKSTITIERDNRSHERGKVSAICIYKKTMLRLSQARAFLFLFTNHQKKSLLFHESKTRHSSRSAFRLSNTYPFLHSSAFNRRCKNTMIL